MSATTIALTFSTKRGDANRDVNVTFNMTTKNNRNENAADPLVLTLATFLLRNATLGTTPVLHCLWQRAFCDSQVQGIPLSGTKEIMV